MKYKLHPGIVLEIYDQQMTRRNRQDSAWYTIGDSHNIAQLTYGEREVLIYCVGQMRIEHKGKTLRYVDDLIDQGIDTDRKLLKLEVESWINNSWFELFFRIEGDYDFDTEAANDLDICHSTIEAVNAAQEALLDDERWKVSA